MTTTTWRNTAGGDFNTATNWTAGVPVGGDTALITASRTYTVASSQLNTLADLEMAKKATLAVNANEINVTSGTATGALAGTIAVATDAILLLGNNAPSTFNNTGAINLNSGANFADLLIAGPVTLIGKGKINLFGSNADIGSNGAAATLTNGDATSGNTISGGGVIGDAHLTFDNAAKGIIDADNPNVPLTLMPSSIWANAGLIEATKGGTLDLEGNDQELAQTGKGQMKASAGSKIVLSDGFVLFGNTVSIAKGAILEGSQNSALAEAAVKNSGTVASGSEFFIPNIKNTGSGVVVAGVNGPGDIFTLGSVIGGQIEIESDAEVDLGAGSAKVTFESGSNGLLVLTSPQQFTGTISGMSANPGASIILQNIRFADHPTLSYAKGVLTVTDTSTSTPIVDKIKILNGGTFTDQTSGAGYVQIFDPPASAASAPSDGAQLLTQSIGSFGAASGTAGSGTGHVPDQSADFLAAPHHG